MSICIKRIFVLLCISIFFLFITSYANAATLGSASDTITTSRPSASTPLSANSASGVGSVSVSNNGSTFLASDSAHFWGDTQENATIATVSAAKTTLFFTGSTSNTHTNGTVISSAVTAMHKIQFTTATAIPSSGTIVLTFSASASTDSNQASPSASTFMFNNISASSFGNIKTNNASTCTWSQSITAGSPFTLTCTTNAVITTGTTVTILIGCSAASGASCTTQVPTLINPTKTASAGVADSWSLKLETFSAAGRTLLDNTTLKIGTVESVNVVAHIDPTFTFSITGVANGTDLSTVCTSSPDTTNSGFATTSTDVNLGTLTSSATNKAAQKMLITSNSIGGYTITATSSGHLINPVNGFYLQDAQGTPTGNDTPSPVAISNGGNAFGIHACDLTAQGKVNTTTWGNSTVKYANPSASFYYTLVNSTSAPGASGDTIYVEYGASPASTTPAGDYRTVLTYVASAIF